MKSKIQTTTNKEVTKKLGLISLVGIVISAMIGRGIYNLPQNMTAGASASAIILAYVITGIGIWFILTIFPYFISC